MSQLLPILSDEDFAISSYNNTEQVVKDLSMYCTSPVVTMRDITECVGILKSINGVIKSNTEAPFVGLWNGEKWLVTVDGDDIDVPNDNTMFLLLVEFATVHADNPGNFILNNYRELPIPDDLDEYEDHEKLFRKSVHVSLGTYSVVDINNVFSNEILFGYCDSCYTEIVGLKSSFAQYPDYYDFIPGDALGMDVIVFNLTDNTVTVLSGSKIEKVRGMVKSHIYPTRKNIWDYGLNGMSNWTIWAEKNMPLITNNNNGE